MLVRLLGPFVATLGQPTTLCWRLERSGPPTPAGSSNGSGGSGAAQEAPAAVPASRIAFEVLTEVSGSRVTTAACSLVHTCLHCLQMPVCLVAKQHAG